MRSPISRAAVLVLAIAGVAFWFYVPLLIAAVMAIVATLLRRTRITPLAVIVAATMFVLSLSGRRNIVLFAMAAVPLVAEAVGRSGLSSRATSRLGFAALIPAAAARCR